MNSFLRKLILLAGWFFITFKANAEVLRWPQNCVSGKLQITNSLNQNVQGWLQKFNPSLTEETEMSLAPHSTREIAIENSEPLSYFAFLHFQTSRAIEVHFNCESLSASYPASSLEGGLLTFRKSSLAKNQLFLLNLFFDSNTVHIEYLDEIGLVLKADTILLHPFQRMNYEIPATKFAWSSVRLHADNRFVAFNLTLHSAELPTLIQPQPGPQDINAKYFVVADRVNPVDSFIIKLTDPLMILKAQEQINNPKLEKIVFARIQKGHGWFNRNWSKKEKGFWSWSAAEVTNISDLGSTTCNGLPQAVEDRAEAWINEPGRICFWSYRIKKELTAQQVSSGLPIP